MLTQNSIDKINDYLKNKIFKYKGKMFNHLDLNVDIDYKFKILGYKELIVVGIYKNVLSISIEFLNFNDDLSSMFANWIEDYDKNRLTWKDFINSNAITFKYNLEQNIKSVISYLDDPSRIIIFDEIYYSPKDKIVNESKMSRIAVRNVVKDIVKLLKNKVSGFFYLPEDDNNSYSFMNLPFDFSIELTLKISNTIDGFKTDAFYSNEDDVIEIYIIYNPKNLEKNLYTIIGELNELVAHELEHGYQQFNNLDFKIDDSQNLKPFEYYSQDHEIAAQYKGFKRLSKLKKEPFEITVNNWFETHKDIHGLNDEEIKKITKLIKNYKKD